MPLTCVSTKCNPWHHWSSEVTETRSVCPRKTQIIDSQRISVQTYRIVASLPKLQCYYWSNFSHMTLDIIGYLTCRGTIVGHNISNVRHISMSNGKNVMYFFTSSADMTCGPIWCKIICSLFFKKHTKLSIKVLFIFTKIKTKMWKYRLHTFYAVLRLRLDLWLNILVVFVIFIHIFHDKVRF